MTAKKSDCISEYLMRYYSHLDVNGSYVIRFLVNVLKEFACIGLSRPTQHDCVKLAAAKPVLKFLNKDKLNEFSTY